MAMSDAFLSRVHDAYRGVQNEQVAALEAFDGRLNKVRDTWDRPEGGGETPGSCRAAGSSRKGGSISPQWKAQ